MNHAATVTAAKGRTIRCRVFDPTARLWYDSPGWTASEANADLTTLTPTALDSAEENRYSGTVLVPDGGAYTVEYLDGSEIIAEENIDPRFQYLTGDSFTRLGAPSGASIAADIASRAPAASALSSATWTSTMAGYLDAAISSRASQSTVNALVGYVDTEITAILNAVDTEIATILAKVNALPADPADQSQVESAIAAAQGVVTSAISALNNVSEAAVYAQTAAALNAIGATSARMGYIDKLNVTGTLLHSAFTIADGDSLTANSIPLWLRRMRWDLSNKMAITNASGAATTYKDDGTTAAVTRNIADDSTTTTRGAPSWA